MPVGPSDPLASLRTFPIIVALGGQEFTLRPHPALTWLEALADEPPDLTLIIPGMLDEADGPRLDDLLINATVDLDDLGEVILEAVGVAAGRPWWSAVGLIRLLRGANRPLLIRATASLDLNRAPLGAWCDLVYAELAQHMDRKEWNQFTVALEMPPPGVDVRPEELIDEQANTRAFMGLMNQPGR